MFFRDRLKALRQQKQLTQEELSKATGITKSAIGMYESGKREPKYETLEILADYFNVPLDVLLGRDTSKIPVSLSANTERTITDNATFTISGVRRVPVLGSVRCGPGGLAVEESGDYIYVDDTYTNPREIRGFRAVGDSMEGDEIHDGDVCLVRLQDDVEDGSLAVVVIDGEEGTLKRIHRSPGVVVLESSNPAYPPRIFSGDAANGVRVVGRIIEVRHRK